MKRLLMHMLRLMFAAAGVIYIVKAIQWYDTPQSPGIVTILRGADRTLLVVGLLLLLPVYPLQMLRWWLLMRCRGIDVSMGRSFKLLMVGCFFNYCMPGSTGGDVVKAYYAAKRSDRRADTIMSVVFDRITGLLGLILLAGISGLFMLHDPLARKVTTMTWLGALGIVVVSALYFSKRIRRASGLDWLLGRFSPEGLPGKIDQAAVAYGNHKTAVLIAILMSVPVHLLIALSTALSGFALQAPQSIGYLLTVVPIVWLVGSLPLTYQGLGIMEWTAGRLMPDATANQIVGMIMLVRLYMVVYALVGGLFLLQGDVHLHPEEEEKKQVEAQESA